MNNLPLIVVLLFFLTHLPSAATRAGENRPDAPLPTMKEGKTMRIKLPEPSRTGKISLEESLAARRSGRDFSEKPLTLQELAQLLWAAQGITSDRGGRTAPSAGALYPMEVYVVAGNVRNLDPAVYHYEPRSHELTMVTEGDQRAEMARAALNQGSVNDGAVSFVFTGVMARTTRKYGDRGIPYVFMEAGHAAQNVCLQAAALGLAAVTIGAFYNEQVISILGRPAEETPLYIIPVGRKK